MVLKSTLLVLAIGIASNLDNTGVGIAYGVRKIKISLMPNLIIALMGFSLALGGGLFGKWISLWLTPFTCQFISMTVLVSIGVYVLSQQYLTNKPQEQLSDDNLILRILRNPEEADLNNSKSIGFSESLILGVALSINNLAGGFSAGITQLNILATAFVSGLFSFLCTGLCGILGLKLAAGRLGQKATTISGILLILIGVRQIINH